MANDLCENCNKYEWFFTLHFPCLPGQESSKKVCQDCHWKYINLNNGDLPMPNKLTPEDIWILTHISLRPHVMTADNGTEENMSTIKLRGLGLITYDNLLTEGGQLLVEALCSTPLPVQRWMMPR